MAESVRVQSAGEVQSFAAHLSSIMSEIEEATQALRSASESQSMNWNDPQYQSLNESVQQLASQICATANEIESFASYAQNYGNDVSNLA